MIPLEPIPHMTTAWVIGGIFAVLVVALAGRYFDHD